MASLTGQPGSQYVQVAISYQSATHAPTCMHASMHTHQTHTHTHTFMRACTNPYTHAHTHTHACMHAYVCTCTHTHTHTHTSVPQPTPFICFAFAHFGSQLVAVFIIKLLILHCRSLNYFISFFCKESFTVALKKKITNNHEEETQSLNRKYECHTGYTAHYMSAALKPPAPQHLQIILR